MANLNEEVSPSIGKIHHNFCGALESRNDSLLLLREVAPFRYTLQKQMNKDPLQMSLHNIRYQQLFFKDFLEK